MKIILTNCTILLVLGKLIAGNAIASEDRCVIEQLHTVFKGTVQKLSDGHTAKFWLMYMEMVAILKQFIKAERTGNWFLHLHSVNEMLPYLADIRT